MSSHQRIAIGAIFTECNHLGGVPIELSWFERYELMRGDEILTIDAGVIGGMLQVLQAEQLEPLPLLWASTCPGGPLTAGCYQALKDELLDALRNSLPVAGVLLPLHGAAAAEGVDDLEGDIISAVRLTVGADVPIVVTLDLHAHITPEMVRHADALVAWETYPHADAFETGQRGARLLADAVLGRSHPTMAVAKVPVITSAVYGSSHGDDPFAQLMRQAKALEAIEGVLSTSLILVHPYLDCAEMGSGAVVITDNDPALAQKLAGELATAYWARRFEFEPEMWSPEAAVIQGGQLDGGPILLIETADCCGGGGAGDSVATLKALLDADVAESALVPVVDPDVAQACHRAGVGSQVTIRLGHQLDPRWGSAIEVTGTVEQLSDGCFTYHGGIYDGVEGNMGSTAVLVVGSIRILITTYGTYDWRDEQYSALGLDPLRVKYLVVKNPMNYRMVYGERAKGVFILDTPGPTPATVRHIEFQKLQRPFFPLDKEIPDLEPTILV